MNQRATVGQQSASGFVEIFLLIASQAARRLQLLNQVPHANAEGFGHPQKRVQADPLFAALDFANVNWMQAGLLRQLFLAHVRLIPVFPNGISQDFRLSLARHSFLGNQDRTKLETPNMGVFCLARFFEIG